MFGYYRMGLAAKLMAYLVNPKCCHFWTPPNANQKRPISKSALQGFTLAMPMGHPRDPKDVPHIQGAQLLLIFDDIPQRLQLMPLLGSKVQSRK